MVECDLLASNQLFVYEHWINLPAPLLWHCSLNLLPSSSHSKGPKKPFSSMQNSSTLSSNRDKPISPNLIQLEKPLLPPSTFFPFKQGLTSIQISKDWGKGNWNYKSLKFLWQTQVLWCFHTCQHKFITRQNFDFNAFAANTNAEALYLNSASSFHPAKGIFTTHFWLSHWRIEPVHVCHGSKVLWLAHFQTHL